ncbi:TMhelix containing protein [Vibrio phage 1.121.O._10N.286.46.C4]|nr:TMhelix containing protein [Vibrio phage 1.121.O._10N.286.46.C4]
MENIITVFGYSIEIWKLVYITVLVGYGVSFGVGNFFIKAYALVSCRKINQNALGAVCDWIWMTLLVIFVGLHY